MRVVADAASGTVDFVAAADPRRGAFTRVIPSADGAEYLFTLLFAADAPERDVAAQMAVVDTELAAVRAVCETAAGRSPAL